MVNQNKIFSFEIKRQAKNVFPKDVKRTVGIVLTRIVNILTTNQLVCMQCQGFEQLGPRIDKLGRLFAISTKGDDFCNFLFALLCTRTLLKRGLLKKEKMCSHGQQFFSYYSRPFFGGERSNSDSCPY